MIYVLIVLHVAAFAAFVAYWRVADLERKVSALEERHEVLKSRFDDTNLDI